MESYTEEIKRHMSNYKISQLGVNEDGIWKTNKKAYRHILPIARQRLNILETYQEEFWKYFDTQKITLHSDFHHLNSSQAMCFNLFFPFLLEKSDWPIFLKILGFPYTEINEFAFERIIDTGEGTNFDLYLSSFSGIKFLFEVKYSETTFGKAKLDSSHLDKLKRIYVPELQGKISSSYLEEGEFLKHYQIFRNIYYLSRYPTSQLFFIYPCKNTSIDKEEKQISIGLDPDICSRIKVIYLEEIVNLLISSSIKNEKLKRHYMLFQDKYIF